MMVSPDPTYQAPIPILLDRETRTHGHFAWRNGTLQRLPLRVGWYHNGWETRRISDTPPIQPLVFHGLWSIGFRPSNHHIGRVEMASQPPRYDAYLIAMVLREDTTDRPPHVLCGIDHGDICSRREHVLWRREMNHQPERLVSLSLPLMKSQKVSS